MSTKVELTGSEGGQGRAGALAGAVAQEAYQSGAVQAKGKGIELPKVEPIRRDLPKIGRNDLVTIRKNGEEKQLKFKRAEALIENEGWVLVSNQ